MLTEVFGPGCAKDQVLERHAREAVARSGMAHEVVKVSDYAAMTARGVLSTLALAVDGQLKAQGEVVSAEEISRFLRD